MSRYGSMKRENVKKEEVGKASQDQQLPRLLTISCILPVWLQPGCPPPAELYPSTLSGLNQGSRSIHASNIGDWLHTQRKGRMEEDLQKCKEIKHTRVPKGQDCSLRSGQSYFTEQRPNTVPPLKTLQ